MDLVLSFIEDSFAELQTVKSDDQEVELENQIESSKGKVFKRADEILALLKTDPEESWKKANDDDASMTALISAVQKLATYQEDETVAEVKKTISMTKMVKFTIAGSGAFILVFSILLAYRFSKSILEPINESMHAIKTISSGDLTFTTKNTGRDEGAQLVRAL